MLQNVRSECCFTLGTAKPKLVCHCWTDKKDGGGPCATTPCSHAHTATGTNKTGPASPFDRRYTGVASGGGGGGIVTRTSFDESNANTRCRKLFEFDTKKGVCAGNTIMKVDGRVYIADSMAITGRINVYGKEGVYEKTIYNDEMKCPRGMSAADSPDQIVVCDSYCANGSQLVVISAADGKVERVS